MELKENSISEKKNRSRGDNWTQEEKDLFLDIMRKSAPIIENKLTDTNTNKRKNLEWVNIQNKLKELTGKPRDIAQLKGFWRRGKVAAKKNISQHIRALQATGGGQRPPSPPPDDLKIMELCPTDFVIEHNMYDSDGVPQFTGQNNAVIVDNGKHIHNSTMYDIDGDSCNELEGTLINEVITVEDVHSNDIDIKACGNKMEPKVRNANDRKKSDKPKPNTSKASILEANIEIKKRATNMMEAEHELKMKYHKQELAHQELRHKLEIDMLMIEKDKKLLELEILKKKL